MTLKYQVALLSICASLALGHGALAKPHHHHHRPNTAANSLNATNEINNSLNTTSGENSANTSDTDTNGSFIGVVVVFVIIGGIGGLAAYGRRVRNREEVAGTRLRVVANQALDVFMSDAATAYPYQDKFENERIVMLSSAGDELRFIGYSTTNGILKFNTDFKILVDHIREVDLVEHHRQVAHGVAVSRRPNAVGRAVVGDLIGGPTWAIVGAASARTQTKTTTITEQVYSGSELVFAMRDLQNPVLRFQSNQRKDLDKWLFRIKGAMDRQGSSIRLQKQDSSQ